MFWLKLLAFLNCADRACANAGKTRNACISIALGLTLVIKTESRNRAYSYACAAADAIVLINNYCHNVLFLLHGNYITCIFGVQ